MLNRPLVAYQLAWLRQHGISRAVLAVSYRADLIQRLLAADDSTRDANLHYALEDPPLGTGGGLRHAAGFTHGRLVVLNGDSLLDSDLSALLRFHRERRAHVTVGLVHVSEAAAYGRVDTDADGQITAFVEKPQPPGGGHVNAGVYVIEREVVGAIPPERAVSIEREVFPALVAGGVPCFGFPLRGYWRDLGTPAAYRQAHVDLLAGRVVTTLTPAGVGEHGQWIAPSARVDPGATIRGPCVIGRGTDVRAGAIVGPFAVVGDTCALDAGAAVETAILWDGVRVGRGAVIRDAIAGTGVSIGDGASVLDDAVVAPGAEVPGGTRLQGGVLS